MRKLNDTRRTATQLLFLSIGAFLVLSMVAAGLSVGIAGNAGIDLSASPFPELAADQRQQLRLILLLNNLLAFCGAALVALLVVYRKDWIAAAGLRTPRSWPLTGLAMLLFVVSIPLVAYVAWLNLQVPLPDWAVRNEAQTNGLLGAVLTMDSVPEFLLAFLTAAVTPAVGEELLLRGVLQKRILEPLLNNHHLAIWLAAIVFSAGHFEFAGFLPRLVLGAALGYAYFWTNSLWVPIVLHLLFNGTQVVIAYVTGEFSPDTEVTSVPAWWVGLGGLFLSGLVLRYGEQWLAKKQESNVRPV